MAIWTQADIDSVKAALSQGILSVSYAGPPARAVTYQSAAQLLQLLAIMLADVSESNTNGNYYVSAHRSGL